MGLGVKRAAAVVEVPDSEDPLSPSVESFASGASRAPHFPVGEALFLPEVRVFFGRGAVSSVAAMGEEVAGVVVEVGAVVTEASLLDLFFKGFAVTASDAGTEAWTDVGSSSEALARSKTRVEVVLGAVVAVRVAVVVDWGVSVLAGGDALFACLGLLLGAIEFCCLLQELGGEDGRVRRVV